MKITLILLACLAGLIPARAQQGRKIIATHENMNRLQALNPETSLSVQLAEFQIDSIVGRTSELNEKTIAVVFHILYDHPGNKVPKGKVLSQLNALNRDFGTYFPGFNHPAYQREHIGDKIADPEVKFCFPRFTDEPGSIDSSAINYYQVDRAEWSANDAMKIPDSLGVSPWDTDRFLNIWVVDLANSLAGYAQMPGGPNSTDGIVIDYRFFGTVGNPGSEFGEGKTLTHLVGNYLGLYSLWGLTKCADDGVFDTPIHNTPTYFCPDDFHVSLCGDNPIEMFMNFMDSTPDECQNMFTLGQKLRMHATLHPDGPRGNLAWTDLDCPIEKVAPLTPVAVLPKVQAKSTRVFPNPVHSDLQVYFIENIGDNLEITLFDRLGRELIRRSGISATSGTIAIPLTDMPTGTYSLLITKDGDIIDRHQIVITR